MMDVVEEVGGGREGRRGGRGEKKTIVGWLEVTWQIFVEALLCVKQVDSKTSSSAHI